MSYFDFLKGGGIDKNELKDLIREVVKEELKESGQTTREQEDKIGFELHKRWVSMQMEDMQKGGTGNVRPFESLEEELEWRKELLRTI